MNMRTELKLFTNSQYRMEFFVLFIIIQETIVQKSIYSSSYLLLRALNSFRFVWFSILSYIAYLNELLVF